MPASIARRFGLILSALCLLMPALGWAQSYSVLIDTDQDGNTGCSVTLPATGATVTGVERRLSAIVSANGQTVTALTLAECDGGQFGTANPLPGTPYPVNLDGGIDGADVVELAASTDAIAAPGSTLQLYFTAATTGSDDLLATLNGNDAGAPIILTLADTPIPIPGVTGSGLLLLALLMLGVAAWQFRRRGAPRALSLLLISLTGVALAAAPNGDLSEWLGTSPIATDPSGDSSANTDIVAAFAAEAAGGVLCFRLDIVDTEVTTGGNTPPAFTSTPVTTATPGSLYTYNITSTDPDAGDTLTLTGITLPAWLSLTDNGDGSGALSGTPTAADAGANAVQLRVTDSNGGFATQSFTITVGTAANTPPVANSQNVNTDEDQAVTITLTGSDADGDDLAFTLASGPSNGTLSGITQLSSTSAEVTYTPTPNFSGDDSFTFTANDGTEDSAAATVAINVGGTNDTPTANPLSQTTPEDTPITLTLSGSDPDGDALSFSVTGGPSNGTLSAITPLTDTTAEITYTPNLNFNGSDSFTFTVNDGSVDSAAATVSITIDGTNDNPIANPLAQTTPEDTPITLTLSGSDPDGDALSFSVTSGPNNGTISAITPLTDTTAEITYTPDMDFNGSDSFTFQVDDGNGGTATAAVDITINPFNDNPVANAQMLNTNEDIDLPIVLTGSDLDGDVLTFNLISGPSNGTLSAITPIDDISANVTYTPNMDFNGSDSFTFEVDDGNGGTATAVVDITVNPQADEPVANAQMLTMDEDTSLMIILTGSDPDGDVLDFTIVSGPASGSLSPLPPTPIDDTSADITYTPNLDFNGTDSFVFQVDDGTSTPVTATVNITINPINDEPTLDVIGDPTAILENAGQQTINLSGISAGGGETQILTVTASSDNTALIPNPTVNYTSANATGSLDYTPVANQSGSAVITVTVMDDGGTINPGDDDQISRTFTVLVTAVNNAPTFTKGPDQTVLEDAGPQTENGWATAIDDGDPELTQALTFNVINSNNALFSVQPAIDPTGTLTYTPADDAFGSAMVTVTLSDDGSNTPPNVNTSAPQTFTITVDPVNDAPSFTAANPPAVNEDAGAQTVSGWATFDPGNPQESAQTASYTVSNVSTPGLFSTPPSIAANGDLTYTPAPNANGTATFDVAVQDSGGTPNGGVDTSGTQTFTITVNAVNDPPTVMPPPAYAAHAHIGISIPDGATDLLDGSTITDVDGAGAAPFSLTAGGFTSTNGGTGTVNANGSFTYNPPVGFTGSNDTFTYQICDSGVPAPSACTDATATVAVSGPRVWFVNNAGAAGDGRFSAPFNTLAAADTAANANGDRIFVFTGGSAYTGGFTLQDSQRLVGQGVVDTNFDTVFGITPPVTSVARPTINGTRPVINGTIALASNIIARGFDVNNTTAAGVTGSGATGLTINQVSVATTTGTAVNLANSGGTASFTSISANGAVSGIVLNSITGSFTITGDSSTVGSGGTIQNTTGNAVQLTNASNVALNFVNISNSNANGIFGNNVTGFTLNGANVTGNGDAVNEGGLRFDPNLLGTAVISNSTISGSAEHNIEIINTSGTLSSLTISNSTISSNDALLGADGLLLETRNAAQATVVVTGSTFTDNQSDGIQISAIDASVASLTVNDSTFTSSLDMSPAGSVGARGIVLSASTNADLSFDIGGTTSNTFENFSPNIGEEAINVTLVSTSTAASLTSGRINNNTFINSGGAIGIDVRGNGALVMEIDGNTANTSRQAIDVITGDAVGDAATADLTITNNTLTVAGTVANPNNEAIGFLGDRNTTNCLNIRSNNATASGTRDDILLDDFTSAPGSMVLESGATDCGGACATAEAHLLSNNMITDAFAAGIGFVVPGTCNTVP